MNSSNPEARRALRRAMESLRDVVERATVEETRPNHWRVFVYASRDPWRDGGVIRRIIRTITDAVDRGSGVYTDIYIFDAREFRPARGETPI